MISHDHLCIPYQTALQWDDVQIIRILDDQAGENGDPQVLGDHMQDGTHAAAANGRVACNMIVIKQSFQSLVIDIHGGIGENKSLIIQLGKRQVLSPVERMPLSDNHIVRILEAGNAF